MANSEIIQELAPVVTFLRENPVQFLATVGLDGKPKVRPFQFMTEQDGKLWFCTGNKKEVYSELTKQPYVELSAASRNNAWLRIAARVVFEDNRQIKDWIIEHSPLVKSIYKSGDNPVFEVFYLADGEATIMDFTGNPPKKFKV